MRNEIIYVELKSGYSDNGPAWIGKAEYSKSGRTLYFNGKAFRSIGGAGISGNYMDFETSEEYWISGVKKDQQDRHWAGSGKVFIDKHVVSDYLSIIGRTELDPRRFQITALDNDFNLVKTRMHELENSKLKS